MAQKEEIIKRVYEITLFYRKKDLNASTGGTLLAPAPPAPSPLEVSHIQILKKCPEPENCDRSVIHQAEDLLIRQRVEPVQSILDSWIKGAKAQINGHDVPFSQIISWCQDADSKDERRAIRREARSLCRFLAPFSHATWKALLDCVENELEYGNYLDFCHEKRGPGFGRYPRIAADFLKDSDEVYFSLMNRWLSSAVEPLEMDDADRFDAIYLLGLRYLDHTFPEKMKGGLGTDKVLDFFNTFVPEGRSIRIHSDGGKGRQAYCIPVEIPGEIHVIVGPLQGWQDLEAIFHELGHAVFFVNNSPDLSASEKDYFQSAALSEAFAFLFQALCMSTHFLVDFLGIKPEVAQILEALHRIKFLTLSRRYAAKVCIEHENFRKNRVAHGQDLYARLMKRYTGFHYDPETYLFDLMPDFYSMDYFEAFMGSVTIRNFLEHSFGPRWYEGEGASMMMAWWRSGNRYCLADFLKRRLAKDTEYESLLDSASLGHDSLFENVKKMAQII
ncbi:MAG: hypothetical protein DSZ23_02300 [Thermodesulfatator sp.]|nr:MAG: hypothetical protein DSZ23_02300 [Thermodesulfatator sp.]